jgi:hypothetical protein
MMELDENCQRKGIRFGAARKVDNTGLPSDFCFEEF